MSHKVNANRVVNQLRRHADRLMDVHLSLHFLKKYGSYLVFKEKETYRYLTLVTFVTKLSYQQRTKCSLLERPTMKASQLTAMPSHSTNSIIAEQVIFEHLLRHLDGKYTNNRNKQESILVGCVLVWGSAPPHPDADPPEADHGEWTLPQVG